MRAVVLGGGGAMAGPALEAAATSPHLTQLVVADRDKGRARAGAARAGGTAQPRQLDVTDPTGLAEVLADADIVANFVGPYYRFGPTVLDASIAAGCHYVDICDDWEPTLALLDRDEEARSAGVTCVVGLGASPGISNVLAALAMAHLDRVDEVVTGWSLEGDPEALDDEVGADHLAALEHWIHQLSGTIRVCEGGELVDVAPLRHEPLLYPGLGRLSTWTVGHPEPLTIARTRPEVRRSLNVMLAADDLVPLLRRLARRVDAGRTDEQGAARRLAQILGLVARSPRWLTRRLVHPTRTVPALLAVAAGARDGIPTRVGAGLRAVPAGGMGPMTGIPAAIGLDLIASGRLSAPGVHPPEAVVDARAFLDALAPWCTPVGTHAADVVEVRVLSEVIDPFST